MNVDAEIDRALSVARPCFAAADHQIHFVGEHLDVACNVAIWNREMDTEAGRALWGRRRVLYFVFDPTSGQFAPCKFCAFVNAKLGTASDFTEATLPMTMDLYVSLDESEPRFDGNRAQKHLTKRLGMIPVNSHAVSADAPMMVAEDQRMAVLFEYWHAQHRAAIQIDQRGPVILRPPLWYQN